MAPDAAASSLRLPAAATGSSVGKLPDQAPPLLAQGDHQAATVNGNGNGKQQQVECPRCGSGNTKFCYYNNYSTAQPRHFCRACRRYWTHGGSLRNVPVGGACRSRHRDAAASGNANNNNKRRSRRAGSDNSSSSSAAPNQLPPTAALMFPFLSDGAAFFLPPQYDLGLGAGSAAATPSAFSWPLYDGGIGAAPWDDGTAAGATPGAWGEDEFTGLDLSWPPPAGN